MSELYSLPDGWEWKKLVDIGIISTGKTPPKINKEFYENGTIRFVKPPNLKNSFEIAKLESDEFISDIGAKKSTLLPKNSLMVCCIGSLGKFALSNEEVITNQQINSIIFDENVIYFKFGYYYGFKFEKLLNEVANEAVVKIVNKTTFLNLDIPLPPLEEQKRIVAKLDILFAKIDKAIALHQKNIDEADIFMASVLNDVFVELEEKYGVKEINSLFKIKSGNFLPAKNMVEDGEINVYGGNGINGKHNEFNLSGENIIIGRVGALCGNVRCVNDNIWLTDNAFYISEYFEEIDKNFLAQMLIHIDLGSSANKSAQPVISYKSICEMKLPLPPLPTQKKVVAYLDEISNKMEKIKQIQKEKMQSLKELKASILDKAFKGEL